MSRRLTVPLLATLIVALVATPIFAYTVILKDGTEIEASEKPRLDEATGQVIIELVNGTETSIAATEIDFAKTEEFNRDSFEGVRVIEHGKVKQLPSDEPEKKPDLQDVAGRVELDVGREPVSRPRQDVPTGPELTPGGNRDFDTLPRRSLGDAEIASELESYFTSQGLEAHVFGGSRRGHALVEVVTDSESAVFKSLQVAAQALPQLRERHASRIAALELLLETSRDGPAGQFVMTPELAGQLNSGETDVPTFYIRHVRF